MWRTFQLTTPDPIGVAVVLTAWSVCLPEPPIGPLQVGQRTWLEVSQVRLRKREILQLRYGLGVAAPAIEAVNLGCHILIDIVELQNWAPRDQPGALAAAIMGWASEEFGFTAPALG